MDEQNTLTGLVTPTNQGTTTTGFFVKQDVSVNFDPYSGGFMGISLTGLDQLERDIKETVIKAAQDVIDGFANDNAVWNTALQGKTKEAAIHYVNEIKLLLQAYISTYNDFITVANKAASELITYDKQNEGEIEEAVNAIEYMKRGIETEAQSINVDGANQYYGIN
jgi:hypothetical protein